MPTLRKTQEIFAQSILTGASVGDTVASDWLSLIDATSNASGACAISSAGRQRQEKVRSTKSEVRPVAYDIPVMVLVLRTSNFVLRFSYFLVFNRLFSAIDHQDLNRPALRIQFQPKLLLHGGKDRRSA